MRRSTYSLATVFLVVAIVGIAAASLRGLWVRVEGGQSSEAYVPVVVAALGGAVFGFVLAVWTRTEFFAHPRNMARFGLLSMLGAVVGAGAGAQATARIGWAVLLLMPPLMVGCAAMVAYNRRRRRRRMAKAATVNARPPLVHPLDRIDAQPLDDLVPVDDDELANSEHRGPEHQGTSEGA